jgi:hypothetical protein
VIYEYRKYEVVPGQLQRLNARFEEVTLPLWEAHGIRQSGFWEALVGVSNELHYLLQWETMAEREERWSAFHGDPEWIAARTRSEQEGQLIARIANSFWKPTSYSNWQ